MKKINYYKALEFASKKHKGSFRIGGEKYIIHPIAVSEILKDKGFDEEVQIIGLFHDLLEDTDATEKEIKMFGNDNVLKIVKLLTKEKDYKMDEYIKEISRNKIALNVKIADRLHNLRSAIAANKEFRRKYIVETLEYYYDLSKITSFFNEIKKALDKVNDSIPNKFYCSRCKHWIKKDYQAEKRTRDGKVICENCLIDYEISFDEYEDWLKNED